MIEQDRPKQRRRLMSNTAHPTRLTETEADQLAQRVEALGFHMVKVVPRDDGGYLVHAWVPAIERDGRTWAPHEVNFWDFEDLRGWRWNSTEEWSIDL
jgi:hypothetical protein